MEADLVLSEELIKSVVLVNRVN